MALEEWAWEYSQALIFYKNTSAFLFIPPKQDAFSEYSDFSLRGILFIVLKLKTIIEKPVNDYDAETNI